MHSCPNPLHCILPPYILDRMAESDNPAARKLAVEAIARSACAPVNAPATPAQRCSYF